MTKSTMMSIDSEQPKIHIVLHHHGKGRLQRDYSEMLNLLLVLIQRITTHGWKDVVISILPKYSEDVKTDLPNERAVNALKDGFENVMGAANTIEKCGGEEWRIAFCPRKRYEEHVMERKLRLTQRVVGGRGRSGRA